MTKQQVSTSIYLKYNSISWHWFVGEEVGRSENRFMLMWNPTGQVLLKLGLQTAYANIDEALCSYFWCCFCFGLRHRNKYHIVSLIFIYLEFTNDNLLKWKHVNELHSSHSHRKRTKCHNLVFSCIILWSVYTERE